MSTWVRTAVLALALINQVLGLFGISELPISEGAVAMAFTGAASMWAWWKNNSITCKARKADVYLAQLKEVETDGSTECKSKEQ